RTLQWLFCGFVLLACMAGHARSEDAYPNKPVRLIVGFGAGGPTDIPARYIADKLGDRLGQNVIVENKPAAAGMVATRYALAQPKDGYTLLLCTHFDAINFAVHKDPQYKLSELAPISLISKYFYGLGLSNAVPAKTLREFVDYAKSHPGDIKYASLGPGSAQDIFARQLAKLTGIRMSAVPYRSGSQVMQDFIPGRVQFYVSPMLALMPLIGRNDAKVLGVSSPDRLKAVSQIPTLREQGIDFVRFGWLGICAPAGTPQPVIDVLNRNIKSIVASPDYQAMIERAASIPASSSPSELRTVMDDTLAYVMQTVQEFGLQQE
ncbi:MAG TPA: tripartite tricarboxylate transporter substrate binding protein, partial [Xanthobacteraceae bacterium]|nr:tripartite tricarboxylate transporter substrate binding protein [Xanthobacteraceae bacterium]